MAPPEQDSLSSVTTQMLTEVWRAFIGGVVTLAAWGLTRFGRRIASVEERLRKLELWRARHEGVNQALGRHSSGDRDEEADDADDTI